MWAHAGGAKCLVVFKGFGTMSYEGLMNCRRKRDVVKNGFQWEFKVLKCAFCRVVDFYLFGFVEPWHFFQMNRPTCC